MESFAERLSIPTPETSRLVKQRREFRWVLNLLDRQKITRPSEIVLVLGKFSMDSLLFMMAKAGRESVRRVISEFIIRMRHVRPIMTGKDLKEMGFEPGPIFGSILNSLREACLDGSVRDFEEERNFVKKLFLQKKAVSLKEA
jgi:tRNA nucleotidyltransferase (CCA-adding enzyme)